MQSCVCRFSNPVALELKSVGRCVKHFISSVEETCAQMHREIVLHGVDEERQAAVARYTRTVPRACQRLPARSWRLVSLRDRFRPLQLMPARRSAPRSRHKMGYPALNWI